MGLISSTSTGARPATSIASSRARSRPTCRCRRRPSIELVDQSQDRQGARPRRADNAARPRRRGDRVKRREFITLLGGAAAAWPLAARAQQPRAHAAHRRAHDHEPRTIRKCRPASPRSCRGCSNWAGPTAATCGSTIAGAQAMPTLFANMRRNWSRSRRTSSWPLAAASVGPLQQATRTVPIVFVNVADPVGAGFVESLARPGGNATGFIAYSNTA